MVAECGFIRLHVICATTKRSPHIEGMVMVDHDVSARRSASWFGADGKVGFVHRSKMYNQGGQSSMFDGRPVIGIANSASDLAPCNAHLGRVAEAVKRGVLMAGGVPLEFPTISLGE